MVDTTKLSPAVRAYLRLDDDALPPPRHSTRFAPPISADPRDRDFHSDPGDRDIEAFRRLEQRL